MGKRSGSLSLEALIILTLIILTVSIGHIQIQKAKSITQVNDAKILIADVFKKYAVLSLDRRIIHKIAFDYGGKFLDVFDSDDEKKEHLDLPKDIRYASVYGGVVPPTITAKITEDGNITPIFTIYIFDRGDLARYRISLYGFDTLKHLRIYIYKNKGDQTAKYGDIVNFHSKFSEGSKLWERE
ncbi:MAG: hypothetical protein LBQ96_03355 [Fusobacteriaceae bacterium]|jgi:hypothetical protein|nr:hypothetical protein [Fusobacteriaceae bacterium]